MDRAHDLATELTPDNLEKAAQFIDNRGKAMPKDNQHTATAAIVMAATSSDATVKVEPSHEAIRTVMAIDSQDTAQQDEQEPKVVCLDNLLGANSEAVKQLDAMQEKLASRLEVLDHIAFNVRKVNSMRSEQTAQTAQTEQTAGIAQSVEIAKNVQTAETKQVLPKVEITKETQTLDVHTTQNFTDTVQNAVEIAKSTKPLAAKVVANINSHSPNDKTMQTLDAALQNSSKMLLDLVTDSGNTQDNVEIKVDLAAGNQEGVEQKLIARIAKIGQFTQQQGMYLSEVSKTFTHELEALVASYKHEKIDLAAEVQVQQAEKNKLIESNADLSRQLEKMQQTIKILETVKANADATIQEQLKKVERFGNMVENEQELRKQADKRTQIAIQKARQYAALKKAEEKRRIHAEAQAKKAVMRAREVMSYFFNSTVEDSFGKVRQQQQALMGGLADFEDMLFTKKNLI